MPSCAGPVKPGIHVTLSHRIGQLGLLERENAAILNAALQPLAARLIPSFQSALARVGVRCQLFLTANDGTLLQADAAQQVFALLASLPLAEVLCEHACMQACM